MMIKIDHCLSHWSIDDVVVEVEFALVTSKSQIYE